MQVTTRDARLVFGYFWAVASAALILTIFLFAKSIAAQWIIDVRSPLTFFSFVIVNGLFLVFMWLLVGFCILITAMLPFGTSFAIAERFSIQNVWYYLACGTLAGLVGTPVFAALSGGLHSPPFYERCITNAPLIALCGTVGGLAYWWKAGRWAGTARTSLDSAIPK
jgi:hypothetical protein